MLEQYRKNVRQGILFGVMIILLGIGLKGGGIVSIAVLAAGFLAWLWGWWSLAKAKGQRRIAGISILISLLTFIYVLILTLFADSDFYEHTLIGKATPPIGLAGFFSIFIIAFLPDKNKINTTQIKGKKKLSAAILLFLIWLIMTIAFTILGISNSKEPVSTDIIVALGGSSLCLFPIILVTMIVKHFLSPGKNKKKNPD